IWAKPTLQELKVSFVRCSNVLGMCNFLCAVTSLANHSYLSSDAAKLGTNEWYFFSNRERKYATGFRNNRATACGYWKATGKDRPVFHSSTCEIIGMRKTLVFYRGRAPNGMKTGWIMHEFRLEIQSHGPPPKEDWVICRVFRKTKGEQTMECSLLNESYATTATAPPSPPKFTSTPHISQTMQDGCQQHQENSLNFYQGLMFPNDAVESLATLESNIQDQFLQAGINIPISFISSKINDEYGFLLDMNLED
ncbi:hypothetical protein GIB67_026838, partial [Kingdonia uniflora]